MASDRPNPPPRAARSNGYRPISPAPPPASTGRVVARTPAHDSPAQAVLYTVQQLDDAVDTLARYVLTELPAGFSIRLDLNAQEVMLSLVDPDGAVVNGCEPGQHADVVALCRRAQRVALDSGSAS